MIKTVALSKSFDGKEALRTVNMNVADGSIYGLVGTNGSGKTTILKHIAGIFRGDLGYVEVDGADVFENEEVKQRMCFIPDELHFFDGYSLKDMRRLYSGVYDNWNDDRFENMVKQFKLELSGRISRFSKGMQKQAAFILALSAMPDYLILDEPVDGLYPIMRRLVWEYIINDVSERGMTVVISSHNLKEIEGVCDTVGILNEGQLVMEKELDDLKTNVHKVQVAFREKTDNPYEDIQVLHMDTYGSVDVLIARCDRGELEDKLNRHDPVVLDILPLTLEEIFIYELGGLEDEYNEIFA